MSGAGLDYGDDDPPFICPLTQEPCVRAFCEDYGCATKANVPLDDYDYAQGSTNWDDLMPRIPVVRKKRKVRK